MSCFTEWSRDEDPGLHDLYARKLLILGWGGDLDKYELAYIKRKLSKNPTLRVRWGFLRGRGYKLSDARIRHRAMWGLEPPPSGTGCLGRCPECPSGRLEVISPARGRERIASG